MNTMYDPETGKTMAHSGPCQESGCLCEAYVESANVGGWPFCVRAACMHSGHRHAWTEVPE